MPGVGRLEHVDLSQKLDKGEYEERLSAAQTRLTELRLQLAGLIGEGGIGPPVCMVFEGWDASGASST
jgi:polyphosphate kinase 2 (PPK2 family)